MIFFKLKSMVFGGFFSDFQIKINLIKMPSDAYWTYEKYIQVSFLSSP